MLLRPGQAKIFFRPFSTNQATDDNLLKMTKERFRKNDRVLRGITDDARVMIINNTKTTNVAKQKHNLSNLSTRLLGRALSGAAILAASLKGDERVLLEWMADGPMKKVYAEATRAGEVRGYVSHPNLEMPNSTPLGYAMRTGTLTVTHILYNMATPYCSSLSIAGADIITDLESYFKTVDQIPTIVELDTTLDHQGNAKFSGQHSLPQSCHNRARKLLLTVLGGIIIQPLPQGSYQESCKVIDYYRQHLKSMPPVGILFGEDGQPLDDIMMAVASKEVSAVDRIALDFHCRCSRDKYLQQLRALVPTEKAKFLNFYEGEEDNSGDVEKNSNNRKKKQIKTPNASRPPRGYDLRLQRYCGNHSKVMDQKTELSRETTSFREKWLALQLAKREAEYTTLKEIGVLCGTWNVNSKKPTDDISLWLDTAWNPAIVFVGIQEMDMSAQGIIFRETESKATEWEKLFLEALNKEHLPDPKYTLIESKQIGGVFSCCFIHQDYKHFLSQTCTAVAITGILGVVANKGGAGIRFKIADSSFCFINAHFNAHQANVEIRNEDYKTITSQMLFYLPELQKEGQEPIAFAVNDHDNIFWIGDLNYRIDLPNEFVRQRIENHDWDTLRSSDQLLTQKKRGNVFQGWNEAPIHFAPTYKYDNNSTNYDSSKLNRAPAWTDRILWRSTYTKILFYNRQELMSSDHRPVHAGFAVDLKSTDPEKQANVIIDINEQFETTVDVTPSVALSEMELNFGTVQYATPTQKTIQIENDSNSIIQWSFIPKLNQTSICKTWLKISPTNGMLGPKESTMVTFTCHVTKKVIMAGLQEAMEDLAILQTINMGQDPNDYFISFKAKYRQSVFGSSLARLVQLPFPLCVNKPYPGLKLKIPKEIWRMCDWIFNRGISAHEIFIRKGKPSQLVTLRNCLDTGDPLPDDCDAHSVGEALLMFLNSLQEPLIPLDQFSAALAASSNFTQCKQFLSRLPEVNCNVFYYLTAFLRDVLQHSSENKLTPQKLTLVFSKAFFRTPANQKTEGSKLLRAEQKAAFVLHFLIPINHMRAETGQ